MIFSGGHGCIGPAGPEPSAKCEIKDGSRAIGASCHKLQTVFVVCVHATQLPVIGVQLKMLPLMFGFIGAALACYSNFYVIFMQGGVGKNGSTVAVSCLENLITHTHTRLTALFPGPPG